jgi:hypothetical protein
MARVIAFIDSRFSGKGSRVQTSYITEVFDEKKRFKGASFYVTPCTLEP